MRKNKKKLFLVPTQTPEKPIIHQGQVVATFMNEMSSALQELKARREFCDDAGAYLKRINHINAFEAFRKERKNTRTGG